MLRRQTHGNQVIVDTPQVSLVWDEELKSINVTWHGPFVTGPEYRSHLMRILDVLVEKQGSRMLLDMRDMPVMSPDDQEWSEREWMPRSVATGLKYTAVVMPKSALARSTLRHLAKGASKIDRQRAYFQGLEEARAWLMAMPDKG